MTRPWESMLPRPWEAAQPIYDRLVAVHRNKTEAGPGTGNIGLGGYSGPEQPTTSPAGEAVLYTGIIAGIQQRSAGRASGGPLPADVSYRPEWVIEIPAGAGVPRYGIRDRDIIVDEEGYRYVVEAARWSSLGYRLSCVRLEI
jgi:hypothetical protein